MAKKKNVDFSTFNDWDIEAELKRALGNFSDEIKKASEEGLTEAAEYLRDCLEAASPVGETGEYRRSWVCSTKYRGVRYVGNSKKNKSGIPVSAVLEFGSKGHPHIRRVFETEKDKLVDIITKHLK